MYQCEGPAILLGSLSLHLNHLIASRVANYNCPFGTLPFGLFGWNLDTRDLETYPRTYSGYFWNMSIFDDSRAVWVLFRKWVVSENQSFLDEGVIVTPLISLVLGGEVPRLNHGPIFSQSKTLKGVLRAVESRVPLFWHFHKGLKCTYRNTPHLHIKPSLYVCRRVQGSQIFKQNWIISIRSRVIVILLIWVYVALGGGAGGWGVSKVINYSLYEFRSVQR